MTALVPCFCLYQPRTETGSQLGFGCRRCRSSPQLRPQRSGQRRGAGCWRTGRRRQTLGLQTPNPTQPGSEAEALSRARPTEEVKHTPNGARILQTSAFAQRVLGPSPNISLPATAVPDEPESTVSLRGRIPVGYLDDRSHYPGKRLPSSPVSATEEAGNPKEKDFLQLFPPTLPKGKREMEGKRNPVVGKLCFKTSVPFASTSTTDVLNTWCKTGGTNTKAYTNKITSYLIFTRDEATPDTLTKRLPSTQKTAVKE